MRSSCFFFAHRLPRCLASRYRYKEFFSDSDPKASEHFGRIVSEAHTARLRRYLDETKGTVVFGGETDLENKYVAPTLVRDVPSDDSLMQEYVSFCTFVCPIKY